MEGWGWRGREYVVLDICEMSHKKFGNLRSLHDSNLQVLLVILILKSRFCSQKCGCDVVLKVACVVEAILRKPALKFSLCIEQFFL